MLSTRQKQNLEHWIEALRSGKYVQGKNRLKTKAVPAMNKPERFCCLGVACEIFKVEWLEGIHPSNYGYYFPPRLEVRIHTNDTPPLPWMRDMFGIDDQAIIDSLAIINDEKEKSFAEIADYIENLADAIEKGEPIWA